MRRSLLALAFALIGASLIAPVKAQTIAAVTVNGSVVIVTGNTFQTVLSGVTGTTQLRSLTMQNNNTNGDSCWIYVGAGSPTKGTSILLMPGGSYTRYYPYVPSDPIKATCTTTADTLYVDTQ